MKKSLLSIFLMTLIITSSYSLKAKELIPNKTNNSSSINTASGLSLMNPDNAPCNLKEPLVNGANFDNLTAAVTDDVPTGELGDLCFLGNMSGEGNLVDADLNNFASVNITGIDCNGEFQVVDSNHVYPTGMFAGFKVSSDGLLQASIAATVTIKIYNNNTLFQTYDAVTALSGLDSSLIDEDGNVVLGVITTTDFDEIRIEYQSLGGALFEAEVYYPVVQQFCEATLLCNAPTSFTNAEFPVIINYSNTGPDSVTCALCTVTNAENVITSSDSDYASLQLTLGVNAEASIAVEDVLTTYPANTFAGFEIENVPVLADIQTASIKITTYSRDFDGNPVFVEDKTGTFALAGATTPGVSDRRIIGFITTLPFDQIQLTFINTAGVDLGETRVYRAVVEKFCPVEIPCNETVYLNNGDLGFPVIIDEFKTGLTGLGCVGCAVNNSSNVISPDLTDFAKIEILAGASISGTISVVDAVSTFPEGSIAGFAIEDVLFDPLLVDPLGQFNLLAESITICTFLDGVEQECTTGIDLLDLTAVPNDIFGTADGRYNIGFQTTKSYDEITITVAPSLAGALIDLNVFGAFVDTSTATGEFAVLCPCLDPPVADAAPPVEACDTYTLPALSAGNAYWTATGGTGAEVAAGTDITTTTTLYVYAAATGSCVADENELVITIEYTPKAGIDGAITICAGDAQPDNAALFAALTGDPDVGGAWSGPVAGVYTYTVTATAPCTVDDTSTVTVTEQAQPNAGIDGAITICAGDAQPDNAALFAALTGDPDVGGAWSGPVAGVYTYTVTATAPCTVDDTSTVTVTEQAQPNAGIDGAITICAGDAQPDNAALFAALTGDPDVGGAWSGPVAGVYTYTVTATAPCTVDDTSTVTVTEQAQPNAGIDGAITICAGDAQPDNAALFAALTGDPDVGGAWSGPVAGVYTYTVTATAPCTVDDTSTVTVTEQAQPNAGIDGAITICAGDAQPDNAALFAALTGDPDVGGAWSGPVAGVYTYTVTATAPCTVDDTSTVTVTEQAQPNAGIDGAITICAGDAQPDNAALFAALTGDPDVGGAWSGPVAGVYTYTVTATAPCTVDDTSTVTVTEQAQPNAGIDGAITICAGDAQPDNAALFAALTGDPDVGGAWSGPVAGVYTYTVTATAPCTVDDTSTVTVTEQAQPNAGIDGAITICAGDAQPDNAALFAALTGDPDVGGAWSGPVAGVYTYTVTATAPCTVDDTSTVTVTEQAQPNAGIDGAITICAGDAQPDNAALFAALTGDPDVGGAWSGPVAGVYTYTVTATAPCTVDDTSTVTVTEQAQPNAGIDGAITICAGDAQPDNAALFAALTGDPDVGGAWSGPVAGVYTYTVTATAPCTVDDTSTVTVTEQAQPNAGIDGAITICAGDAQPDNAALFAALTGDPDVGGAWSGPVAGVYTYTVTATAPCTVDDTSTVTVTEQAQPNAGIDGAITICAGDAQPDNAALFAALTGDPDVGGAWSGPVAGVYTYTVTATAPCTVDDTSTVTVTEQAQPNAGIDGAITICAGDAQPDNAALFAALTGDPDVGGAWSGPVAGVYTYTVTATAPCTVDDTSTVTVTEQAQPNAGIDGAITICAGDAQPDNAALFAALTGDPDVGGAWSGPVAGVYTYTVTATAPCTVDDTSTVTVTEQAQPNAGIDGAITICAGDAQPDNAALFAALTGDPDVGGAWSGPVAGVYTYTVTATAPCTVDDTSTVTVTEQAQPNAGTDGSYVVCTGQELTEGILFDSLGGTPNTGGVWTPEITPSSREGIYTYTVTATSPCTGEVSANVVVTACIIDAIAESFPSINGYDGGVTTTVLGSDTLNGDPVNPSEVTITVGVSDAELVLDPLTGLITVAAQTAAGDYTVEYTICENLNPTNCNTVIETVTVTAAPLVAVDDVAGPINGYDGGDAGVDVLDNDTLNGVPVIPSEVVITSTPTGPLTVNADGSVTVDPGTAAGDYDIDYTICEILNPTNCSTSTVTVTVVPAPIDAVAESFPSINGYDGGVTTTVLGSDTLNGDPVNPSEVTITVGVSDAELVLDPLTGLITVAAQTAAGDYTVEYTICENLNPTNCNTVIETVTVTAAPLVAVDDVAGPINGYDGGDAGVDVLDNDTLNGVPVIPSEVVITSTPTGPLTVNADGSVTVDPGTAAGDYDIDYTICEILNPTNCSTSTVTVTVVPAPIDAVAESFPSINGYDGGVTTTVLGSDTLNGDPVNPSEVTITVGVSDAELVLDPLTGLITVAAQTAAGDYTVEYTICENLNPTNCNTVIETVTVTAAPLVAVDDVAGPINGYDGGDAGVDVLDNDTLNGVPVIPSEVVITSTPTGPLTVNADGSVTVDPGTAAGDYDIDYTICEILNPTNCSTSTVTVTVVPAPIDAVAESFPSINGYDGGVTTTVLGSDTLNGDPVNPSEVTITVGVSDAELVLDPLTGLITVAAQTAAGDYTVEYTICENLNPTNCNTVIETVTVTAAPLVAVDDVAGPINGYDGGDAGVDVLDNDTLNGVPVIPSEVVITSTPTGPLTVNADGSVTVDPGTAAGDYDIDYTICEILNPTNCSTSTVTVTVVPAPIDAVAESFPSINGYDGGVTTTVLGSDTLNGDPVNPSEVTITVGVSDAELVLDPLTGLITVAAQTAAGDYTVEYTICENLNPTNCNTVIETVTVTAAPLVAVDDVAGPINGYDGGDAGVDVLDNDTLNGVPVIPSEVVITSTPTGPLTVNADGSVTVDPGTAAGDYDIDYTICEILNPTNCSTSTVTVTVVPAPIDAVAESFPSINGYDGGVTTTVLGSDTLNGDPVNPSEVTITVGVSDAELVLDPLTGLITVAAQTAAGDYTVEYTICENLNPTNCNTVIETVTVTAAPLVAVDDVAGPINGYDGGDAGVDVLDNDTLNGVPVIPSEVVITSTPTGPLTVNADGSVTVDPGTAAGDYDIDYTICEILNPTNCSTSTVTVTVVPAPIDAVAESFPSINGYDGGVTTTVLGSDTLNGDPVNPSEVTITVGVSDAELVLDPLTGLITVAAQTAAGDYTVEYTICENLNPTNCNTVIETVTVTAAPLVAVDDVAGPINGYDGGDAGVDVLDNDTLNGVPVIPSEVVITSTPTGPLTVNADGSVTVDPGTAAGDYDIDYTICEILNPTNCSTSTVTVTVVPAPIDAVAESFPSINGYDGGVTTTVLGSDTLNGDPVNPSEVTITVGVSDAELVLDPLTGLITVAAQTAAGDYTVEYTICENLNPTNCNTVIETVTVTAAPLVAVDDVAGPINGYDGGDAGVDVLDNDTLNGVPVIPSEVVITSTPTGPLTVNADGSVTVDPGTAAGDYDIDYTICEILNPTNCSTSTVTVTVVPAPIDAVAESFPSINGYDGGVTTTVLGSDTLNGDPVNPSEVTITVGVSDAELVLDPLTGLITVAAQTAAGDYTVEYTICENLNPTNCDTVTQTVTVEAAPIDAVNDTAGPINGYDGGDAGIDVLDNDTLNGVSVIPSEVVITSTPTGPLTVNTDGSVTVAAGTMAGDYDIEYTICEILNPTNCSTSTVTVTVVPAPIDAVAESFPSINGYDGGVTTTVLGSDTLNGDPVNPSEVTITVGVSDAELVLDPLTGLITVAAQTAAGDYTVEYTICENLNPTNCNTVIETVTVTAAPLVAVDDVAGPINGYDGGDAGVDVLDNDTLNGVPVIPSEVVITSTPTGPLTVNADGSVTVDPGTAAGDYDIDYTICEILNPTNCSTSTVTVTVVPAPIDAVAESFPSINGYDGGVTTTVLGSDTLNGDPVNPSEVTITVGVSDAELVLDPLTGLITVAAQTAAGDYTVEYTICENLNPTNCNTVIETVTVTAAPLVAVDDVAGPINGYDGGDAGVDVLDNDTLNGVPVIPSEVVITSTPTGPLTVNADGSVTVDPGTAAGDYDIDYTICEILNPTNCSTSTVTVTVVPAPIDAVAESFPSINGYDGGVTTTVLGSDTLNGDPVNPSEVTITVGVSDAELVLDPLTGLITVAAQTAAGDYTVEYTICENLNPTNCNTVIETVTVTAAPLVAVDDVAGPINGYDGGDAGVDVLDNDTLNGVPVIPSEVVITSTPTGPLTVNADGSVTVDPGTAAGDYDIDYTICEILNPTNCSTSTVTVTVVPAPIDAVAESFPSINGYDGGVTTTVLGSDTLNGDPVNPSEVTITVGVSDAELVLDPLTGLITVAAQTAAGDYTVEYTICENLNPTNCNTVIETVTVTAAPLVAVDDVAGPINGYDGGDAGVDVLDNDTLNGVPVIPSEVVITSTPTGPLTVNADGSVTVDPGTAAGDYDIDYTICEILNPTNCSTSTVTVTVVPAPIDAVAESFPSINGYDGGVTTTVLGSDTLNGDPVNPSEVTITVGVSDAELVLDPLTGLITVAAQTAAGDYTVEYTICENLNPTNCNTVIETVTVTAAPLVAVDDVAGPINGYDGGDAGVDVLDNDTLNGVPVIPSEVVITSTPTGPLTVNADGSVTVDPGTAAGDYDIDYTICEILNPTNCSTSTVTVTVVPAPIDAVAESFPSINGYDGGVTTTVLGSDTLNGDPVNPSEVTITVGVSDAELVLDPLTGLITVAAQTAAGDYTVEYTICENLNPTNCDTVTQTVTVEAAPIDAVNDTAGPINGYDGGDAGIDVLDNDTLNGVSVIPSEVVITSTPTGPLTVNTDGSVTVAAGTMAGDYDIEYTICEILNPTNCSTSTVTVTVVPAPIDAVAESFPSINGYDGGVTTTVLGSDTLNGDPVNPSEVTITVGVSDAELVLDPLTGLITVAAQTAAGDYTVEYTICENLNPTNCNTVIETVTVTAAPLVAVDDVAGPINGYDGGDAGVDVLDNDTLNGVPVIPSEVVITSTPTGPLTVNADGSVTVDPGTAAGDYDIDYTICEILNPTNCSTSTVTVTVVPAPIDAGDDEAGPVSCTTGGDAGINVLDNDTLNGDPVIPSEVVITSTPTTELTVNIDGSVDVTIGTAAGTYTVDYIICEILNPGNCDTATVTVIIHDVTPPVISCPADATVECTDPTDPDATGYATGSDVCGGVAITWEDSSVSNCGNTETIIRTWTATDNSGNSTSCVQTISVVDTTAPTIDVQASGLTVQCGIDNAAAIDAWLAANGGAVASDTCGNVSWSNDFTALNDDCGAMGSATVIFTATDDCENFITTTATILVASINIVKTFTNDSVIAGGAESSFTLVVTNDGTAPLSNVLITDDIDSRLTVTSVSGTNGSNDDSDANVQTVEWLITSLASGDSETITVNFTVDSSIEEANGVGALNDEDNVPNLTEVNAVATENNSITVNDEDGDTIDILVDIDLSIVKTFDPTQVPQGTYQTFTIVVTNDGPSDAVDVSVTDLVDNSLEVTNISVTSGSGDCSASAGQDLDCTVQIPTGESVTVTVEYLTAPFFDDSGSTYGTGIGDDFYFVFVNGSVLEGSTDGGPVYLDGVDITADVTIITSLTRNDIVFDPPGPDPAFELHLSCSDPFTGGWGQSGGPVIGVDTNWQIAYFTIGRYSPQGFLKSCGNVVNPFDVPNTAYSTGDDSFGTETVDDDAIVKIGPGITLDRLQTNGKRLTARLTNLTGDDKIIDEIEVKWPERNGNLTKVWLTFGNTKKVIWQGNENYDPEGLVVLNATDSNWNGGTLFTGEAILRFDFKGKVANSGYTIRVHFMDGTWLDINVPDESASKESELSKESNRSNFKAYPVPFKDELTIEYRFDYDTDVTIEVFDTKGALIKTNKKHNYKSGYNEKLKLDFSRHDNQLYFIKIGTNREQIIKKVISKGK